MLISQRSRRVVVLGSFMGMGCSGSSSSDEAASTGEVPSSGTSSEPSLSSTSEAAESSSETGEPAPTSSESSEDPDSTGGEGIGATCTTYLSCLLQTCPECYAGALELYGARAACWDTPEQTAACNQACEALIAERATECECEGTECTACVVLEEGHHYIYTDNVVYECEPDQTPYRFDSVRVTYVDGRALAIALELFVYSSGYTEHIELLGTHPCAGGPFDVSYEFGDYTWWTATLNSAPDGTTSIEAQGYSKKYGNFCRASAQFGGP